MGSPPPHQHHHHHHQYEGTPINIEKTDNKLISNISKMFGGVYQDDSEEEKANEEFNDYYDNYTADM